MARVYTSTAEIERVLRRVRVKGHSLIVCVFTGTGSPKYLEPMARDPAPPTGVPFGGDFPEVYRSALRSNQAIHDGAVLLGRADTDKEYKVVGWSMRMFPPSAGIASHPNRGSAFNSCLAMSVRPDVDALYLRSEEDLVRFAKGEATAAL